MLMFDDLNMLPLMNEEIEYLPLVSIEEDGQDEELASKEFIPILPLRNTILFPGVVIPITVGRERSVSAVKKAYEEDKYIGVLTQKQPEVEVPNMEDLNTTGTIARIMKLLKMPDGSTTIIIHGKDRFYLEELLEIDPHLRGKISVLDEQESPTDNEFKAMIASMKDLAEQIIHLSPGIPTEASVILKNIDKAEFLIHFISSNLKIKNQEKQALLEISDIKERAHWVLKYLNTELQLLELKNQIQTKVRSDLDKQQRDYFLNQQLKTIQEELHGDGSNDEMDKLRARAVKQVWPQRAKERFDKELNRIKRLNPAVPEYSMALNYIELLLELPWDKVSKDGFDLKKAAKILEKDHYGLEKVKKRILEYLAVLKLKGDMKSPILCFVGPPGVGKTSLGKSIAKALKREFVRMSLGGLHDESEIRGHRKTYIGAMPGRIIQSIRKVASSNPVFILDEIDKVGANFRGDPSSALLEVLDPEQNSTFYDNYLEVEYDLSKVLFIATANSLSNMHPALRDRMEIITISGYSLEEKLEIAKKHLVPKQRVEHGLNGKQIRLNKAVLSKTIDEYTRESGVRQLDRTIAALMRATAKSVAMEEAYNINLNTKDVERILGLKKYDKDIYKDDNPPGVAIGLAWTQTGGDILFIESSLYKGKGQLKLTGNLGDVMKESATTALSFIRSNATLLEVDPVVFDENDFHIHVPEGGIPKDGPSAGITILSALCSVITKRKIKPFLAMTGEITLRGKVLPVGGIKEKILAAKRAGLNTIILSSINQRDVEQINPDFIKGLQFHYVKNMMQVVELALN